VGRQVEALPAYAACLNLVPTYQSAHFNAGNVWRRLKRLPQAASAYRQAIALDAKDHEAHFRLAKVLEELGQFEAAAAAWRQGLAVLPAGAPNRADVAQRLLRAENAVRLDRQAARIIRGQESPATASEWLRCIDSAHRNGRTLSAARLWKRLLAERSEITAAPGSKARYDAAVAALRVGLGLGRDTGDLDAADRARWRLQALAWLQADLARFADLEAGGADADRALVRTACQLWQGDPALAGVRGADALGRLPEGEREAWSQFWGQVADLLRRARQSSV
jgi:tetratricopeptide (TPR) repeat protein